MTDLGTRAGDPPPAVPTFVSAAVRYDDPDGNPVIWRERFLSHDAAFAWVRAVADEAIARGVRSVDVDVRPTR